MKKLAARMADRNVLLGRLRDSYARYRPADVWCLEGPERHGGPALKIVYVGWKAHKNYFRQLAFGDQGRERHLGRCWTQPGPKILRSVPDAALGVIETGTEQFSRLGQPEDFYVPFWIDGDIEVHPEPRGRSLRDDLRKIRKYAYRYEVVKSAEQFDFFYRTMYRPYISEIYKDDAVLMSYEAMMRRREACELLLILRDGEPVAGDILVWEHGGGVRGWSLGVKDGNRRLVQEGVIGALYYYRDRYLAGRGIERYCAGASRAFLNDGVLQFKKKWGLGRLRPRPGGFWIRVLQESDGLRSFLGHNPFIRYTEGRLAGTVFVDSANAPSAEATDALSESCRKLGLGELTIARLRSPGAGVEFNTTRD